MCGSLDDGDAQWQSHTKELRERYEEARRDAEETRASRELEECTFEPRLNARRPPPTLE